MGMRSEKTRPRRSSAGVAEGRKRRCIERNRILVEKAFDRSLLDDRLFSQGVQVFEQPPFGVLDRNAEKDEISPSNSLSHVLVGVVYVHTVDVVCFGQVLQQSGEDKPSDLSLVTHHERRAKHGPMIDRKSHREAPDVQKERRLEPKMAESDGHRETTVKGLSNRFAGKI
jgi:hypothetical protein